MKKSLCFKILEDHLLRGELVPGEEITIRMDQTLTQDSTGTMVYLQLEALNPKELKTQRSVAYIDHNMLQAGFENADDHVFIRSVAAKRGIVFSKPGGGICHQVHLERFSKPGITLLGSDSHTPTSGGMGALAIGAGGLDVAVAMAMGEYNLIVPKVVNIRLSGALRPGVNAKDVILEILKKRTVKGGVGCVMEYSGEGIKSLSVTDRATICNMGAELGATTSIFPSDEQTREYLVALGRGKDYRELSADSDAIYDEWMDLDLSEIQPLAAMPHSPDAVKSIREIGPIKVDQVAIGSCTNSSYSDMMKVAKYLEGKRVSPEVDLVISPGSATILEMLARNGALATMVSAGARILESACGPCIGMGQAPKTGAVSLRTFNRNFKGRSGTMSAEVFLVSPETAVVSAVAGVLTDPTEFFTEIEIQQPDRYPEASGGFIYPEEADFGEVVMGPNIKPFPMGHALEENVSGKVLIKVGDNITTDDIVPSHAKLLPYRSNVPHLAKFSFSTIIEDFHLRAEEHGGGFILGGSNYGQGSSREHAALVPLYLGVRGVLAKGFARIHRSNLINSGILPLVFVNPGDYDKVEEFDALEIDGIRASLERGGDVLVRNLRSGEEYEMLLEVSERERKTLLSGGYLPYLKESTK
ncbi:MAG: aconitate hydratase [Tissierellia bacterium]|nr:aconitate hydratase [Tissierellia bacterium]